MGFSTYNCHIPRCQHIKTNGVQCGSPALRRRKFCYFHNRWRATHLDLNRAGSLHFTTHVELPVLEDADSIQVALMQVLRLILCRQLDSKTGGLMLYGLQTASLNLRHLDVEHRRKTNVVVEPRRVKENGLGDQAWSPADFEQEESDQQDFVQEEEDCAEEEEPEAQPEQEESIPTTHVARTPSSARDTPDDARERSENSITNPNREEEYSEQDIQTALEGAQQGRWQDLKTVFELAGIFPPAESASQ